MGLLDDLGLLARHVPGDARNALKGLLGDMPLTKALRGESEVSANGLKNALMGMQVGPDAQGSYDAAMQIGPQAMGGLLGKIVYHGSPHKFDKFDASKIGTGEGAQAYGHGVYLADSEGVARSYRYSTTKPEFSVAGKRYVSDDSGVLRDQTGKTIGNQPQALQDAANALYGSKADSPISVLAEEAESFLQTRAGYSAKRIAAAKQAILDGAVKPDPRGALYKADLPDEWIPKMLDWDKPLSQQQDILSKFPDEVLDNLGVTRGGMDAYAGKPLAGGDFVRFVENQKGKGSLANYGIPGIRYLDGGSRPKNVVDSRLLSFYDKHGGDAAAAVDDFMRGVYESPKVKEKMRAQFLEQLQNPPTYNYVVFPGLEDKVKILERNGMPLGLLGQ